MAGGLSELDTGMPERTGSVEERLRALYDYLALLLENLRYLLRNLGPENLNESELLPWLNDALEVKTLISNTVITNELYADYGAIADLTVDELRTDYAKARRYLAGNTGPLDYLYIHDEQIEFLSGTVHLDGGVPATEQLHHRGRYFYWTDGTRTQMTAAEQTAWPVTVYVYDELIKGAFAFRTVTTSGGTVKVPVLTLGAGTGDPTDAALGRGFLRKDADRLALFLHGSADNGIFIGQYTDLVGLRKTTSLNFSNYENGSFTETVDGGLTETYGVRFDENGYPVAITDGSGHQTEVIW